jgi:rubrerythrin
MDETSAPAFVFGCLACGKTVSGGEPKCPRCGASFEDVKFECPFCGELISPEEHRCPSCGTEFAIFADEVSEKSSIDLDNGSADPAEVDAGSTEFECPACGKSVSESDKSCPHCGALFSE